MATSPSCTPIQCKSIAPQLAVPDVMAAADYYRDVLGFRICGIFGAPPFYAIVARDYVEIHLGQLDPGRAPAPNVTRREDAIDVYIWVNDVDAMYAELQKSGAKILEGPVTRHYKCYELLIEDIFGFRLTFAVDLNGSEN